MTIYELIQDLVDYSPDTEIVFEYKNQTEYNCDFTYHPLLRELHIKPD